METFYVAKVSVLYFLPFIHKKYWFVYGFQQGYL